MSNFFDFDEIKKVSGDPFAQTSAFKVDERFYTLPKDEKGEGIALIAFVPDPERRLIQRMYKINSSVVLPNGKRRFVSEWSPQTVGQPDPFHEAWQKLYNAGKTDEARQFARQTRYVTNIKVIKDPRKPENEGKIFFYEMSQRMVDKIKNAIEPSQEALGLGEERKEVFNPMKNIVMKLVAKKGANGILSYDDSSFITSPKAIYESEEAAINDIKTNAHCLSDLTKADAFLSYEELKKKLDWLTGSEPQETPEIVEVAEPKVEASEVVEPKPTPETKKVDSVEDLLDDLIN